MNRILVFLHITLMLVGSTSAGLFTKRNLILRSFRYKACPEHTAVVQALDLSVSSTSEGALIIGGTFLSAVNLTSPLKVKVSMTRSVFGLISVPVPCMKTFGSCTFDNICELAYPEDQICPGKLDEHDVPCKCPIEQGRYVLPGAQFSIDPTRWAALLSGTYRGSAKLLSNSTPLACYNFTFELQ